MGVPFNFVSMKDRALPDLDKCRDPGMIWFLSVHHDIKPVLLMHAHGRVGSETFLESVICVFLRFLK